MRKQRYIDLSTPWKLPGQGCCVSRNWPFPKFLVLGSLKSKKIYYYDVNTQRYSRFCLIVCYDGRIICDNNSIKFIP